MIFGNVWVELAIGREILRLLRLKIIDLKSFLIGRVVTTIVKLIPFIEDYIALLLHLLH